MGIPGPGMLHGFFYLIRKVRPWRSKNDLRSFLKASDSHDAFFVLVLFCRTREYILYIHKKDEGAFFSETDYTTCAYE